MFCVCEGVFVCIVCVHVCVCRKICAVYYSLHHLILVFSSSKKKFVSVQMCWVCSRSERGVYKCVCVRVRVCVSESLLSRRMSVCVCASVASIIKCLELHRSA